MRALSKRFQGSVSLYPREGDSQWSDLDLSKPADEQRILRAFTTPEAAYEHGIALGHILASISRQFFKTSIVERLCGEPSWR